MLKDKAVYYYRQEGRSCAEAVLLGANDVYALGLTPGEVSLFAGFRTGMGCGSTCGALTGAMGVLSRMFGAREDFNALCGRFVAVFEKALGCGSTDCAPLAQKYKTEAERCSRAVELGAEALEGFIASVQTPAQTKDEGCTLSAEDIKRVKGMGFLQHKGTNRFNARVITRNGRITHEECRVIADAAQRYGDGHMMMTTRLTIEVSGIHYDNIDAFCAALAEAGLQVGGTGSKVRPVVSCKGTTCQYGLYDTYAISEEIHRRFYLGYRAVALPHKFKIAVGGCPNNCVKPNLNDLGIIGARVPQYNAELCKGCKKCQLEAACPIGAAAMKDGKLVIDPAACNGCGRCLGKCPFHCCDEGADGWRVYVGGRWGKKVSHGQLLPRLITQREELLDVVEKAILLFRSEGISGERFADTIERIGFDRTQELILGSELLEKKAEILGLNVSGGASC